MWTSLVDPTGKNALASVLVRPTYQDLQTEPDHSPVGGPSTLLHSPFTSHTSHLPYPCPLRLLPLPFALGTKYGAVYAEGAASSSCTIASSACTTASMSGRRGSW